MHSQDFTQIPIIDISSPTPQTLSNLRTALTDIGFLYISNHSVPPSTITSLIDILPDLFALSPEAKQEIALEKSPHFLGYSAAGTETTAGKTDLREQVELATELERAPDGAPLYDGLRGPNQWPNALPELKGVVTRYIEELTLLGERFLRLVARALDLPDDIFFSYLSDQHRLKLVHYPASTTSSQGVGPHKDSSGWWTFLLQASPEVNGLQVLNKSGSWIDVPAIPDTFVVNIGQAFEVVTNGVCKATTHRVLSSPKERFSIPFFQGVRRDLTRDEAMTSLKEHFERWGEGEEAGEAGAVDNPFDTKMAPELPARQTFTAPSGNVYSYIFIPPTSQSTTLLFLHGFPSSLTDWVHQICHFSSEGYGVVALDLLGYGESSKPTDVNAYRLKPMGDEVIELLDHLNLKTIVGIGHDFGATLLSRMAAYHPSRWEALVFLAVGPPKLGTPFDVDMINTMTKQFLGYEMLGYIPWLADFRSQEILEKNAEAVMSLMFCRDREEWEAWFHPLGKMEEFVRQNRRLPIASWYTQDLQKAHLKAFGSTDGYKGVCRWYRMWKDNLFAPDEQGFEEFHISQPVLFIVPSEPEQSAAQQQQMISSWSTNLQTVKLNTNHWIHIQAPSETNTTIQNFLTSRRET
ncbi:epoxide hydrolase [Fusarium subglutinans]|uniref:Epoxide hydrolase n=1 Tax=Gibberella subglutinans TaxID=42677 RepID=A0A8H5QCE6_GIBSU|nr:epoxide hydrolase [Fusarium subglutinans]KAF5611902.1 epoxide hydrolase [Fusarium subglutinans]